MTRHIFHRSRATLITVRRGRINGYFYYWYNEGLIGAWQDARARVFGLTDFFSFETLLKTLFAPWKNDVQAARNIALSDQLNLWGQNLASRIFGFLIRSIMLLVAILVVGMFSAIVGIYLLLWLLAPLLIIILPVLALMLVL